jgi:hypothetical protein
MAGQGYKTNHENHTKGDVTSTLHLSPPTGRILGAAGGLGGGFGGTGGGFGFAGRGGFFGRAGGFGFAGGGFLRLAGGFTGPAGGRGSFGVRCVKPGTLKDDAQAPADEPPGRAAAGGAKLPGFFIYSMKNFKHLPAFFTFVIVGRHKSSPSIFNFGFV